MTLIKFDDNELTSFYETWISLLSAQIEDIDKNLNTIGGEKKDEEQLKQCAKELKNLPLNKEVFVGLTKLGEELFKDHCRVNTIDDLVSFVAENFPSGYAAQAEKPLKSFYSAFDKSYQAPEAVRERTAAVDVLRKLQQDPQIGYDKDLRQMSKFFGVPEDTVIKCNISLYSNKFMCDGMAAGGGFFINYALSDKGKACVANSVVPERKLSTPLHESTHYLFHQSPMYKIFKHEADRVMEGKKPLYPGIHRVISTMKDYFEQNPEAKRYGNVNDNLSGAILSGFDEALAASASALQDEKKCRITDPNYNVLQDKNREWYHGFEGANKLAPAVFPLFKSYLAEGKPIDNSFFMKLADNMQEFQKMRNNSRNNSAGNLSQTAIIANKQNRQPR